MKEAVVTFGENRGLMGILTAGHKPRESDRQTAVVILGAGITHRVGPNRLNVKIARQMAARGRPVLRFDFSGIGDSPAATGDFTFEERAAGEAQAAMDLMQSRLNCSRFILMGICSGAGIAFETAWRDSRVQGAVLINPVWHLVGPNPDKNKREWVMAKRANLRRNLPAALFSQACWKSLFTLDTAFLGLVKNEIAGLWRKKETPGRLYMDGRQTPEFKFDELRRRSVDLLHIYSERDIGLDYFRTCLPKEAQKREQAGQVRIIAGANHTFTPLWSQAALFEMIADYMKAKE